jgi:hypothetical protein
VLADLVGVERGRKLLFDRTWFSLGLVKNPMYQSALRRSNHTPRGVCETQEKIISPFLATAKQKAKFGEKFGRFAKPDPGARSWAFAVAQLDQ